MLINDLRCLGEGPTFPHMAGLNFFFCIQYSHLKCVKGANVL